MKQLTNKRPLCYMLDNSYLVSSLPFIDQELGNSIPKSKVLYLIKTEQQQMQKDPLAYIDSLKQPELSYANSEHFESELARVQAKFEQKEKEKLDNKQGKSKKKQTSFSDLPKKITPKQLPNIENLVNSNIISYQNVLNKTVNLDLYKKFGPLILKQLIEVLEKERNNLASRIQGEKQTIENMNQNRKYIQTQSYQRQHDIEERIKIMLNKRRKVD